MNLPILFTQINDKKGTVFSCHRGNLEEIGIFVKEIRLVFWGTEQNDKYKPFHKIFTLLLKINSLEITQSKFHVDVIRFFRMVKGCQSKKKMADEVLENNITSDTLKLDRKDPIDIDGWRQFISDFNQEFFLARLKILYLLP